MTDRRMFWEENDADETMYSLQQIVLPADIRRAASVNAPRTTAPVATDSHNVCDIAATDDAIYELANIRRAISYGVGTTGIIRRLVNPKFGPQRD
jgi:hypothetical protein